MCKNSRSVVKLIRRKRESLIRVQEKQSISHPLAQPNAFPSIPIEQQVGVLVAVGAAVCVAVAVAVEVADAVAGAVGRGVAVAVAVIVALARSRARSNCADG